MSAAAGPDRAELARLAREHTVVLARLRAAVEARSGDANATLLHDDAAASFYRLFGAAGACDAGARAMDADAVIAAGSALASAGCLATSAPITLTGVVVVLVGCAWGWAVTRDPTGAATRSGTDSAQHHDVRRTVRP